jgi:hypothetical protein
MRPRDRIGIVIVVATLLCAISASLLLLLRTAPLTFALAGSFAAPLVVAGVVLTGRWFYVALHGHARLPKPRIRPGRMESRPYTWAQRRRPRT